MHNAFGAPNGPLYVASGKEFECRSHLDPLATVFTPDGESAAGVSSYNAKNVGSLHYMLKPLFEPRSSLLSSRMHFLEISLLQNGHVGN